CAELELEREQSAVRACCRLDEREPLTCDGVGEGVAGLDGGLICHATSKPGRRETHNGCQSRCDTRSSTVIGMDAIAGLLDGPRARRAFLLRCAMDPPWSLRIEDEAPLSLVAVLRGRAWVVPERADPVLVGAGDVALVRGPDHYLFCDDPATPPQGIIHPDQRCTTPDGQEVVAMKSFGVRRWGNSPDGSTEVLTGTYNVEGEVSRRLLDA